jgi:type IV secretory pathway VirJ component
VSAALALALLAAAPALEPVPQTLTFGRFGTVTLYQTSPHPSRVALFVSGDGGWNLGVVEMAKALAAQDTLVAGIDIRHYLKRLDGAKDACSFPAGDFESLGQYLEKKLGFPKFVSPVLVGYSSGATLVYAVLVQAPPNTFRGALSLGFCPDLEVAKGFCKGHGLVSEKLSKGGRLFQAQPRLEPPWVALQGSEDQVCSANATEEFVSQMPTAKFIRLEKVGHGFSVQSRWLPQFKDAFTRIADVQGPAGARDNERDVLSQGHLHPPDAGVLADVSDLPLVEVSAKAPERDVLAIVLSGDGGWAGIDRELASVLAEKGIPVVGLDSLKYFWTARTPEEGAKDLERVVRHYLSDWKKSKVWLVGYSRGADVMGFFASRMPKDVLAQVDRVALLGPSLKTEFEFHLTDWLGGDESGGQPILPEVEKLKGIPVLCLYGKDETDSLCTHAGPGVLVPLAFEGGHHFDGNYAALAQAIIDGAKK